MPYRVWVNGRGGRHLCRFVPTGRVSATQWGPVFIGHLYFPPFDGKSTSFVPSRFFADEMEPWLL